MLLKISVLVFAALPGLARRNLPSRRVAVRTTNDTVIPPAEGSIPLWPEGGPKCSDITEQQIPNGPFAAVMCALAEHATSWLPTATRNNNANATAEFNVFAPQPTDVGFGETDTGGTIHGTSQSLNSNEWLPVNTTTLGDTIEGANCWWPAGFYSAIRQVRFVQNGDLGPHETQLLTMLTNRHGRWVTEDTAAGYYALLAHADSSPMTVWAKDETTKLKEAKAYTALRGWRGPGGVMKVKLKDPWGETTDYKVEEIANDIKVVMYLKNWDEFPDEPAGSDEGEEDDNCECARRRRRDGNSL